MMQLWFLGVASLLLRALTHKEPDPHPLQRIFLRPPICMGLEADWLGQILYVFELNSDEQTYLRFTTLSLSAESGSL